MTIQCAMTLCLMSSTGASLGHAQVSSPRSPFDLAVTNISIASVHILTNNVVGYHFADARFGVYNVDELDQELAKSGIKSKRLIRIMEGTNVVAEGRLFGRSWGIRANGFLLKFDAPEAARKAAAVMHEKGTLVFPKHYNTDRKAWTVY